MYCIDVSGGVVFLSLSVGTRVPLKGVVGSWRAFVAASS